MQSRLQELDSLECRLALFSTEDLLERKASDLELTIEAHQAIGAILKERGVNEETSSAPRRQDERTGRKVLRTAAKVSKRLLEFLFVPQVSSRRYCLVAAALPFGLSVSVAASAAFALHLFGVDATQRAPRFHLTPLMILLIGVVGPLIETALLAFGLWFLKHLFLRPVHLAIASAIVWGLMHSLQAPFWFFGVVFSFFVMSAAYIAWRKTSRTHAFIAPAPIRVLINSTVLLIQGLEKLFPY